MEDEDSGLRHRYTSRSSVLATHGERPGSRVNPNECRGTSLYWISRVEPCGRPVCPRVLAWHVTLLSGHRLLDFLFRLLELYRPA